MQWIKTSEQLPSKPVKTTDWIDCLIIHRKKISIASFCWTIRSDKKLLANDYVPLWILRCGNCHFGCKNGEVNPEFWMPLPTLPPLRSNKAKKQKVKRPAKIFTSTGSKRICPQLSCTIDPDEKKILDESALMISNKFGKVITISAIGGILIRYGYANRENLLKELN